MLSLFIWIYSFCHIVFACKKKVFTTFFVCFENIDNITENINILHHSLMEIEDLWYILFCKNLVKALAFKNIYIIYEASIDHFRRNIHFFYIKSEWINSFAKSVFIDDGENELMQNKNIQPKLLSKLILLVFCSILIKIDCKNFKTNLSNLNSCHVNWTFINNFYETIVFYFHWNVPFQIKEKLNIYLNFKNVIGVYVPLPQCKKNKKWAKEETKTHPHPTKISHCIIL